MKTEKEKEIEAQDWADLYFKKTGKTVYDLINEGKSIVEIQREFKKLGLPRVPRRCVLRYKTQMSNPSEMFKKIDYEFREFIRSKLGGVVVGTDVILSAILLVGYRKLLEKPDVSVNELIKALDLKAKLNASALNPDEIEKKLMESLEEKDDK